MREGRSRISRHDFDGKFRLFVQQTEIKRKRRKEEDERKIKEASPTGHILTMEPIPRPLGIKRAVILLALHQAGVHASRLDALYVGWPATCFCLYPVGDCARTAHHFPSSTVRVDLGA
jgi:hypothetical protein